MQTTLRIQHLAFAAVAALAVAGCGGGNDGDGDNAANPGGGPVMMVNAFEYVQPIVASGTSETTEPLAVNQLVLSSTETEEPDSRL